MGVEHLFNMARDICHYRRSRLKPEAISKLMIMKHFDSVILQEEVAVTDSDFEMERKQRQHEESNLKKDLELANEVGISDGSDDESDLDLTSNVDDQTIEACTSDVDLPTEPNTPTITSQTSRPTTADVEKMLQV